MSISSNNSIYLFFKNSSAYWSAVIHILTNLILFIIFPASFHFQVHIFKSFACEKIYILAQSYLVAKKIMDFLTCSIALWVDFRGFNYCSKSPFSCRSNISFIWDLKFEAQTQNCMEIFRISWVGTQNLIVGF